MDNSARRDKLGFLVALAVAAIILFVSVVFLFNPHDWPGLGVKIVLPFFMIAGDHYFSGRARLFWLLGIIGIGLAIIFGNATAEAVHYGSGVVLGIVACALSALFGGFCLGCVATRWRADRAAARAEAREEVRR